MSRPVTPGTPAAGHPGYTGEMPVAAPGTLIHDPERLASAAMPPLSSPAISAAPELAVIDWMCGSAGSDVEVPPSTGYSVSASPGPPSVITLSGPYQVTALNVVVPVPETENGESMILMTACLARAPGSQTIAPKSRSVPLPMIATRTPSGATRRAVNGPAAGVMPSEFTTVTSTGWPCDCPGFAAPRSMTIWPAVVAHRLPAGSQLIVVYPVPSRLDSGPRTGPMNSEPSRRAARYRRSGDTAICE